MMEMENFKLGDTVWAFIYCGGMKDVLIYLEDFYLCECEIIGVKQQKSKRTEYMIKDKDLEEDSDIRICEDGFIYKSKEEAIEHLMERVNGGIE